MTNTEYTIEAILSHPSNTFRREDIFSAEDAKKLSPYLTYVVDAGLVIREKRGEFRKADFLSTTPMPELLKLCNVASRSRVSVRRLHPPETTVALETEVEIDPLDILDQLSLELIFDVLATKFNVLASAALPMKNENAHLQDQLRIRESKIQSLQTDILRLEEKLRVLAGENQKLTALFADTRKDRLVMTKPINASGSIVFRDDRKTIKVMRRAK